MSEATTQPTEPQPPSKNFQSCNGYEIRNLFLYLTTCVPRYKIGTCQKNCSVKNPKIISSSKLMAKLQKRFQKRITFIFLRRQMLGRDNDVSHCCCCCSFSSFYLYAFQDKKRQPIHTFIHIYSRISSIRYRT